MASIRSHTASLRRISDGLLVVVILLVVFGVFLGRVVPMTGRQTFIIGGGSMEPTIPLGSAVIVEPVPDGSLAFGDVVSLRTGPALDRIFTHRITRVVTQADGVWVETKGDANASPDASLTPASQIIGRTAYAVPWAGFLLALLSIPSGVLLVVLIACLLIATSWLLESFESDRPGASVGLVPIVPSVASFSEQGAIRRRRARWHSLARGDAPGD